MWVCGALAAGAVRIPNEDSVLRCGLRAHWTHSIYGALAGIAAVAQHTSSMNSLAQLYCWGTTQALAVSRRVVESLRRHYVEVDEKTSWGENFGQARLPCCLCHSSSLQPSLSACMDPQRISILAIEPRRRSLSELKVVIIHCQLLQS